MSIMDKMKQLMAEPIDDDEYDEDYDWDGAKWEEDYDEEGEEAALDGDELVEYAEQTVVYQEAVPGATMRPLRVMSNAANRQCNVGIHTIEIYQPQFYIDQVEMEEYDARPDRYGASVIGKYTKGIGMIEGRFPTDDEDPVSFALTTVHRLMDRMDRVGFNQTANYSFNGKMLPHWNSVGRLDIGSESLIDRSKSMKTYVMDLFERYGDGEADIEGVDMYNACYGGQAAGLCCLNWVESDRWDGRYGLGIATDVSEAFNTSIFAVGSSCAGTMFFPDAPLTHYSMRASCILHRFDFFKPVGWHLMAPISDGKYSVNAYMDCVDMCHLTLKKKMNGKSIVKTCGYNVFHTGGGYHIVKKAYDRMMRSDNADFTIPEKAHLHETKLNPSVHLLKRIGPTHTVSSFLNMSSVIMSQWDKALHKSLVIFTYGSGSAATMYQTMFNDLVWMQPLHQWYIEFYKEAKKLQMPLAGQLHDIYIMVWMKFGYIPYGRQQHKIDPWFYQTDAYYLMEIDAYGRRFYHRGGITAEPMEKKWEMKVDADEGRRSRADWGPLPPKALKQDKAQTLDDIWKELEADMLNEFEPPTSEIVQEGFDKKDPRMKIVCERVQESTNKSVVQHDGARHTYQIIGSWTSLKDPEEMQAASDSVFIFDITVGENGWEEFYLIQDGDPARKICPAVAKSWKALPCIGPYNMNEENRWLLDTRFGAPLEDVGSPGEKYRVTFTWSQSSVKQVEWIKLEGQTGPYPKGNYQLSGSWSQYYVDMTSDGEGNWSKEVTMTSNTMEFYVVRNGDDKQRIYPDVELDSAQNATLKGASGDRVLGVGAWPEGKTAPVWQLKGSLGDKFLINFYRNPELPDEMEVEWSAA